MAKKSRRARAKQSTSSTIARQANTRQVQPGIQGNNRITQQQAISAVSAVKANQYDYVAGDLIRIGIIAGALILVLIILTFVLR